MKVIHVILPKAIIMTKAHRAAVSMVATLRGVLWPDYTASEVFLIFTTQLYHFLVCIFYLYYLVMSLKYSFLNTPDLQYFMLLTSGG